MSSRSAVVTPGRTSWRSARRVRATSRPTRRRPASSSGVSTDMRQRYSLNRDRSETDNAGPREHSVGMRRATTLVLLLAFALPARAAALAVAPVPANPNSACAVGNPCSLDHAVQIASSGDDIDIAPGAYTLSVQRNLDGVDIRGVAGQPAPQIIESGTS